MTLEKELDAFAKDCHNTTGASFTITKLKDSSLWQVYFSGIGKGFKSINLVRAILEAHNYLLITRKELEVKSTYTLYRSKFYEFEKPIRDAGESNRTELGSNS